MIPVSRLMYEWLCQVYGPEAASIYWHPIKITR